MAEPTVVQVSVEVRIQGEDFDVGAELGRLQSRAAGAVALFVGTVRSTDSEPVTGLELEHYPGMTERALAAIVEEATERWPVTGVTVIHRVGHLDVGARIVFVGVAAPHRGAAFDACEFIMDYLKTRAPLWKKLHGADGTAWVGSRTADLAAASRWESPPDAPGTGSDPHDTASPA